jgi:hypothetical protein
VTVQTAKLYKFAIAISTLSLGFGILREFLIVGLLGFSAKNDQLQLYLSVFYTIGLAIDAMRLTCLNLYERLALLHILLITCLVCLPLVVIVGFILDITVEGLDFKILIIALAGSYLNLIVAMLVTYKQRSGQFMWAQLINVIPNFILIPGVLVSYVYARESITLVLICLTSLIPLLQCISLLLLQDKEKPIIKNPLKFIDTIPIFFRHSLTVVGEQLFQIVVRAAFFQLGAGFLTMFALGVRLYSALRFILVDSFIGSRLANWQTENFATYTFNLFTSPVVMLASVILSFIISINSVYLSLQLSLLLVISFYMTTIVRIFYYKINREEINKALIYAVALFEIITAGSAYLYTLSLNYSVLILLWLGFIVKPYGQWWLLRKRYLHLMSFRKLTCDT